MNLITEDLLVGRGRHFGQLNPPIGDVFDLTIRMIRRSRSDDRFICKQRYKLSNNLRVVRAIRINCANDLIRAPFSTRHDRRRNAAIFGMSDDHRVLPTGKVVLQQFERVVGAAIVNEYKLEIEIRIEVVS